MNIRILYTLFLGLCIQYVSAQTDHQTPVKVGKVDKIYSFNGKTYDVYEAKLYFPISVDVSSTLESSNNMYDKSHLIDYNPGTVWVEGVKGNGVGETITFQFKKKELPYIIAFEPGYMKSTQSWNKNNRVAAFELRFLDAQKRLIAQTYVDFLRGGHMVYSGTYAADLTDLFSHSKRMNTFEYLEVEIRKVDDKGTKFSDTCVSGLSFFKRKTKAPIQKISTSAYQKLNSKNN